MAPMVTPTSRAPCVYGEVRVCLGGRDIAYLINALRICACKRQ